MERKLASIQRVSEVSPIEGADRIEQVKVLGWTLVTQKGELKPGDLCVYFEIDSMLPDVPCFEFVKRGSTKGSALRLRTIKLRGIVSQGLAMPESLMGEFTSEDGSLFAYKEGTDVTEFIGVTKWEPKTGGRESVPKGNFPFYVPKTDEIRIQSVPDLLDEVRGIEFYSSVKLDGCSASFILREGEYSVCSRNLSLKNMEEKQRVCDERKAAGKETWTPKPDRWWEMSDKLGMREKLVGKGNFAVQGEICGPGIQKNRLGLKENQLFVFNVFDIDNEHYLDYAHLLEFCKDLELDTVPIENVFTLDDTHTVEALLKMVEGKYDSGQEREGLVFRSTTERRSEVLAGRMSFKVISNKFLLKGGD